MPGVKNVVVVDVAQLILVFGFVLQNPGLALLWRRRHRLTFGHRGLRAGGLTPGVQALVLPETSAISPGFLFLAMGPILRGRGDRIWAYFKQSRS